MAGSILKLMKAGTASSVLEELSKCQCLSWFYWLVHAISHEIVDCMFLSFVCSFARHNFKKPCGPPPMVSDKNSSHFILVKQLTS